MIFLFTEFGAHDIYVGQLKAVLTKQAPGIPTFDLLTMPKRSPSSRPRICSRQRSPGSAPQLDRRRGR